LDAEDQAILSESQALDLYKGLQEIVFLQRYDPPRLSTNNDA
jgi:hypothetical protein